MPEVKVELGLTLKLFRESSYEFIRPTVAIDKIDTSLPVQPQIDEAIAALRLVWDATTEQMNKIVAEEMPQANAQLETQLAAKMKKMEALIGSLSERLKLIEGKKTK